MGKRSAGSIAGAFQRLYALALADREIVQLNAAICSKFLPQNRKRFRHGLDDDQSLGRDTIEQHARPLPDVRADIDYVSQLPRVTRREKREPAELRIKRDPIAVKKFSYRKSPPDVAQFPAILDKIDNTEGQNEFEESFQTDACAAPFFSSAKTSRPAAV